LGRQYSDAQELLDKKYACCHNHILLFFGDQPFHVQGGGYKEKRVTDKYSSD